MAHQCKKVVERVQEAVERGEEAGQQAAHLGECGEIVIPRPVVGRIVAVPPRLVAFTE